MARAVHPKTQLREFAVYFSDLIRRLLYGGIIMTVGVKRTRGETKKIVKNLGYKFMDEYSDKRGNKRIEEKLKNFLDNKNARWSYAL